MNQNDFTNGDDRKTPTGQLIQIVLDYLDENPQCSDPGQSVECLCWSCQFVKALNDVFMEGD